MKLHVLVVAFVLASSAGGVSIENEALKLDFAAAEQGFAIRSVRNKLVGTSFVNPRMAPEPDFWRLVFTAANATGGVEALTLDNRCVCSERTVAHEEDTLRFSWKGCVLTPAEERVDVEASVKLPDGCAASRWEISVRCSSAKWALHDTVYPCFRRVAQPGAADVLLPHVGLGARLLKNFSGESRNLVCAWGEYPYPSYFPMMTAFMKEGGGVFIQADDPEARIKTLWVNDLDVEFRTPVENAGVVGKAAEGPRYAVTLAAFRGDWWQAARLYRNWALRQKWARKGPIASRDDFPRSMREPSFWYCRYLFGDTGRFLRFFERIHAEVPKLNMGIRWYKWHSGDMDTNFPEFLPALDGVGETGKALCDMGYTTMPYINARLWDTKLMSYAYAAKDLTRREDGLPHTEQWRGKPYGKHDFGIMCPFAHDWQDLLQRLAEESLAQTKCNALYYDQVGCAAPKLCHNVRHGHPIGGGRWWADGYRQILQRAHDAFAPRGIAITTEGTAECYMDVCDGFLATSVPTPEDVPFYLAVYSGHTIYFSGRFSPKVPFERAFPLMAREFVWGFANGWSEDWRGSKGIEERTIDAAVRLALERQRLSDFLVLGTLEGPLVAEEYGPSVPYTAWHALHSRQHEVEGHMPAVIGSWWRTADRSRRALIAVNVSDKPQTVRFRAPGNNDSKCVTLDAWATFSREF